MHELDPHAGVSYDRMLQALQTATAPETLSVCPMIRGLVMDSLFPTLDRIAEVEKAGGVQPGIGFSGILPLGVIPPGKMKVLMLFLPFAGGIADAHLRFIRNRSRAASSVGERP